MRLAPLVGFIFLAFIVMILSVYGIAIFGSLDANSPINNTSAYSDQYNDTVDVSIATISLFSFYPLLLAACGIIVAMLIVAVYFRKLR